MTMGAPRRSKISSRLEEWSRTAAESEERTAIIRPSFSTDIQAFVEELGRLGARVQSAGMGAITAVMGPACLTRVAELPNVRAVEEPQVRLPLVP